MEDFLEIAFCYVIYGTAFQRGSQDDGSSPSTGLIVYYCTYSNKGHVIWNGLL